MNKTLINLLSIVIICIISATVLLPLATISAGFVSGFNSGYSDNNSSIINNSPIEIVMVPDEETYLNPTDTIYLEDGNKYASISKSLTLMVPDAKVSRTGVAVSMIAYALNFIALIFMVTYFIKFIVAINKGEIFSKENVKRLRAVACFLFIMSLFSIISGISDEITLSRLNLEFKGFEIGPNWVIPWSDILLGSLSLLMAQVWDRGIKLREEQELTI